MSANLGTAWGNEETLCVSQFEYFAVYPATKPGRHVLLFWNARGNCQAWCCPRIPAFPLCKDSLHPTWAAGKAPATQAHQQSFAKPLVGTRSQRLLGPAEPRCDEGGLRRQRELCAACFFSWPSPTAWLGRGWKSPSTCCKAAQHQAPFTWFLVPWEVSFGRRSFSLFLGKKAGAGAGPHLNPAARGPAAPAPLRKVMLQHAGVPPGPRLKGSVTWARTCPPRGRKEMWLWAGKAAAAESWGEVWEGGGVGERKCIYRGGGSKQLRLPPLTLRCVRRASKKGPQSNWGGWDFASHLWGTRTWWAEGVSGLQGSCKTCRA